MFAGTGLSAGKKKSKLYVDDVFSTYLYTGNGSSQFIENGIALGDGIAQDPYWHKTVLLLHGNGTNGSITIPDATGKNTVSCVGNAQISTTQSKYNGSSIYLDGTGDYIAVPASAFFNVGAGDFSIEGYFYHVATTNRGLFQLSSTAGGFSTSLSTIALGVESSGRLVAYNQGSPSYSANNVYLSSQWYHFAMVRYNGVITVYINGSSVINYTDATNYNFTNLVIGGYYSPSYLFNGYLAEFRFTRAARYTGNFTTPSSPFPDLTTGTVVPGKGGMVWLKNRGTSANHTLIDTVRGAGKILYSNLASAQDTGIGQNLSNFNTNGFTLTETGGWGVNADSQLYASWTFRKAAKFFDIVTYTGTGSPQDIPHNLGVVPGMIIVKPLTTGGATDDWHVWHRGNGTTWRSSLSLNATTASTNNGTTYAHTSTTFNNNWISSAAGFAPRSAGITYVAYLFAHDSSADGIIQCGVYTGNGSSTSGPTVTLGWEPQFLMIKAIVGTTAGSNNWQLLDIMRGISYTSTKVNLAANTNGTEIDATTIKMNPNPTGFQVNATSTGYNENGTIYLYLAIRRPNKPPTSGTGVYSPLTSSSASGTKLTTGFLVDMQMQFLRGTNISDNVSIVDRLRKVSSNTTSGEKVLYSSSTSLETSTATQTLYFDNTGFQIPSNWGGSNTLYLNFRRAPGFFDVVCYIGTGVAGLTIPHSLGVEPELIFIKPLNQAGSWQAPALFGTTSYKQGALEVVDSFNSINYGTGVIYSKPTISSFVVTAAGGVNSNTINYIAYLFASLPGISKVGSYIGNGSSQTINCGFSAGARFILIKRTDSTGDWYVWDSARGIVAANDPHLSLNSTAAEVTTDDSIDPDTTGFIVNQNATTNINVSTATYIYLAIA